MLVIRKPILDLDFFLLGATSYGGVAEIHPSLTLPEEEESSAILYLSHMIQKLQDVE